MSNTTSPRPDAFKALMAEEREAGRPELAHQSRGRPFSESEDLFADALMAIYAEGATGQEDVAKALAAKGILRPSSNDTDWTVDTLSKEMHSLNADLDAAYQENGFGA